MIAKALIVGGGVGGMSAALAMARNNIDVELIDIDPHWRAYGAGISVTGLSLRAFDALGILPEVREQGFVGGGIRLRSPDGSIVMESPAPAEDLAPIDRSGGIMRPALHAIMQGHTRKAGIAVTLGVEPTGFAETEEGVKVSLSDESERMVDLVVAADGIHSRTRATLFPEASPPKFTGQGCWRIVADRPASVDRPEIYVGGPVKLGLNPISEEKLYAFILEHVPDNPWYEEEDMLPHVARLLAPFGGDIAAIRENLGPDSMVNYRPLEWQLLPRPWHRGRVVVIGDAAHATTPHLASGAGAAVEDGLVLAEELARTDDLDAALTAFADRRFERARMIVENSVRIGEIEMLGGNQLDANRMLGDTMEKLKEPY
ncbi:2-polyprenyl-6-methoxyphenol hydroxylase-like FAD-dependent oxidoreductase [Altererythrobacter atlanticus]|uniref:FAD-dependent urate hydroxylase n=1 Tax=Croceibacterium atlanticum TaxID=1267766 RepID=A0A0F7KTJ2_9SPHN|nr:FAD-dependent oxidoreductase [Croceibacterium atlanticum]AKH42884.1 FAD-dependent urate hydroxylase [Croceibacterium atlanticum]MBB5731664.1 2-polyprenyl-6-methoxyphenol hydroxylase-like FAD-dependent oxidoreductase [Croceibacterium atlanticum]